MVCVSTNVGGSHRRVPMRTARLSSKRCSTTLRRPLNYRRYLYATSSRSGQIRSCEVVHHRHARPTHSESCSNHIRQERLSGLRERIGRRATDPECVITFMSGTLQTLMFEHWKGSTGSRSEEHTSELQSLMRKSSAVFCLKKKKR